MRRLRVQFAYLIIAIVFGIAPAAMALQPDEILLIVNRNVPEGGNLAGYYCGIRQIPNDRICGVDLPDADEIPFDTYEMQVVAPVRQFIADHQLRGKIKCLVTMYGMPLRIANKQNTPLEDQELQSMKSRRQMALSEAAAGVADLEKLAASLDGSFKPQSGDSVTDMLHRSQWCIAEIGKDLHSAANGAARDAILAKFIPIVQKLGGLAEVDALVGEMRREDPAETAEQRDDWVKTHENVHMAMQQMADVQTRRWDRNARADLRKVVADYFGLLAEAKTLDAQINYLTVTDTAAALDSELAMLWLDYYPRQHFLVNPIYWRNDQPMRQMLMVSRLDGPHPSIVQDLIRTSVDVENAGLKGKVALDARRIEPVDEHHNANQMGVYDQKIRDLAAFLQAKTKLTVKLDNEAGVFSPHSVDDVALYCGWYSVGHYVPGCDFNRGAVGFHIASYELVSLHNNTRYWVAGLMRDGAVGTLGPVAEPYLAAFPDPQDYFSLLLTGKFPLAEVYWKTTPMVSWMMACIGDPLYTPYKTNPALQMADLPDALRRAVQPAVTGR